MALVAAALAALLLCTAPPAARADGAADGPATLLASAPAFYPRLATAHNTSAPAHPPFALAVVESPTPDERRLVLLRRVTEANNFTAESWARTGAVVASAPAAGDTDLANGFLLQLPSGAILCAYRHHDGAGAARVFRIEVARSLDLGATWSLLSTVTSGATGVWEPLLFAASSEADATVHVFYSAELTNGGEQDVVRQTSLDGGVTWSAVDSRVHTAGSRNGMPGVAEMVDGTQIMVFEGFWSPAGWGHFTVNSARSFDQGSSWEQRAVVHAPADSSANCGSPQVAVCPATAKVVVVFMSSEGAGGGAAWPDGAHIGLISARLDAANVTAPLTWPAAASHVPAATTALWPSLLLDALDGGVEISIRTAFQAPNGSALLAPNTLCID